jgi:hypothetical protein
MRSLFVVGPVLSWRERYVQNYVFAFKTDKSKRRIVSFCGKVLTDKKLPPLFFRSIFILTHHFLCFCLFFLSVPVVWLENAVGGDWGVNLVNSLPKVHSKVH